MKEQLQTALLTILNGTISAASAAKDFLLAEVPDVLRQLLVWKAAEAGVIALVLVAVLALIIVIWWKNREWCLEELGPLNLFPWSIAVGLLSAAICNLLTVVQITLAPKIYLIEYAASLVK